MKTRLGHIPVLAGALALGAAAPAAAQLPQNERLVTADGVRLDFPPDGVWRARARRVAEYRALLRSQGRLAALDATAVSRAAPAGAPAVAGDLFAPAILIGYADTDTSVAVPFKAAQYDSILYTTTPLTGRPYTQRTLYEEMSNDSLHIRGQTYGWILGDTAQTYYLDACGSTENALDCPLGRFRMWELFTGALAALDDSVDFGQYDNDGPDGIPNSGDDDGVVDVVQFVQPLVGGECGGRGVWAHRFTLEAIGGRYGTDDRRPNGELVYVGPYHLVGGVGGITCINAGEIMGIGTASHELGHGLGLPDLYDTGGQTQGVGEWGLMGSANYRSLLSPGHFEAWSKEQLGWVVVREISATGDYTLGPVVTADTVMLVRPRGPNPRGEYLLLENKQALGSDAPNMTEGTRAKIGGLLVWHVDSLKIASARAMNVVNAGSPHGLALVQADARGDLDRTREAGGNRGDAGDPFPGSSANTTFTCGYSPAPLRNSDQGFAGFGLLSITQDAPNGAMTFRFGYASSVPGAMQTAPVAIMGAPYSYVVPFGDVGSARLWTLASGDLPPGLGVAGDGSITGTPEALGTFDVTLEVCSGLAITALPVKLDVEAPVIPVEQVVNQVLALDTTLTANEVRFLDLLGNRNNRLDLGDFLAWVKTVGVKPQAEVMARVTAAAAGRRPTP